MEFDPVFDPVRIAVAAGALVLAGIALYARQWRELGAPRSIVLTACRVLMLAAAALLLLNPVVAVNRPERSRPPFAILVDVSRSMNTQDCEGRPRLTEVQRQLEESGLLESLGAEYELAAYGLAERLRPMEMTELLRLERADGDSSALAHGLETLVRTGPGRTGGYSGALLLSDGRENAGGNPEVAGRLALSLDVPIWTVCVGSSTQLDDVAVVSYVNEDYVFVEKPAHITVDLYQSGYGHATALLRLLREDEEILNQSVGFEGRDRVRVSLPVEEPLAGLYRYAVEVEPLEGETEVRNNRRTVFVRAIDEKLRVLLLEASPHWETKFLAQTLRDDENIALTSLFQLTDRKVFGMEEDPETDIDRPLRQAVVPDAFEPYDVVILGRRAEAFFTAERAAALAAYVAAGGNVIFARGPAMDDRTEDRFGPLSPVFWGQGAIGSFRMALTGHGKSTPVFEIQGGEAAETTFERLPALLGARVVRQARPGANVLAHANVPEWPGDPESLAVVVHQHYGKGSALLVDAAGLWRWEFLPDALSDYDDAYGRFWGQTIRWLTSGELAQPGKRITFRTDRISYEGGDTVHFQVFDRQSRNDELRAVIVVTHPDGSVERLEPRPDRDSRGLYIVSREVHDEGEYEARLEFADPAASVEPVDPADTGLVARYIVYRSSYEDLAVAADPETLRLMAELSGGSLLDLNDLGRLPGELRQVEQMRETEVERRPWWPKQWILSTLLALLGVEWFLRRRSGLY